MTISNIGHSIGESSAAEPLHGAMLTIPQAAARLGVGERFVRRLIHERRIPHHKLGKYIRFEPADLDDWIMRHRVPAIDPRSDSA